MVLEINLNYGYTSIHRIIKYYVSLHVFYGYCKRQDNYELVGLSKHTVTYGYQGNT